MQMRSQCSKSSGYPIAPRHSARPATRSVMSTAKQPALTGNHKRATALVTARLRVASDASVASGRGARSRGSHATAWMVDPRQASTPAPATRSSVVQPLVNVAASRTAAVKPYAPAASRSRRAAGPSARPPAGALADGRDCRQRHRERERRITQERELAERVDGDGRPRRQKDARRDGEQHRRDRRDDDAGQIGERQRPALRCRWPGALLGNVSDGAADHHGCTLLMKAMRASICLSLSWPEKTGITGWNPRTTFAVGVRMLRECRLRRRSRCCRRRAPHGGRTAP